MIKIKKVKSEIRVMSINLLSDVKKTVPLKIFSSFKIGGNAKYFYEAKTVLGLKKALNWAKKNLDKLANFSRIMKEKRAWKKISKQYEKLLK